MKSSVIENPKTNGDPILKTFNNFRINVPRLLPAAG
jgi:hypothetical protein